MWENIGNGDLRYEENTDGGFLNVILKDADDGDVIVIGEDDLELLLERLKKSVKHLHSLNSGKQ